MPGQAQPCHGLPFKYAVGVHRMKGDRGRSGQWPVRAIAGMAYLDLVTMSAWFVLLSLCRDSRSWCVRCFYVLCMGLVSIWAGGVFCGGVFSCVVVFVFVGVLMCMCACVRIGVCVGVLFGTWREFLSVVRCSRRRAERFHVIVGMNKTIVSQQWRM